MNSLLDQVTQYYWIAGLAYFLGAIPFGLLITKYFLGFDVREQGSGNIGMTNVMRTAGKTPGIITFLLDFGKGALAVFLAVHFAPNAIELQALVGVLAVFGHTRSVFLKFTGGKGVATNYGVWAFLDWHIFVLIAGVWVGVFLLKRISSLSALTSLAFFPAVTYFFHGFSPFFIAALLLALYILVLHKENIQRLLEGKEGVLKKEK